MQNMYDRKALFFDSLAEETWASKEYGPRELAKLHRLFEAVGPINGSAVLEPGCGTGRLTEILSERVGPSGTVIATDISRAMLEAARIRNAGLENVKLNLARAEDFLDGKHKYDLIICHQVFPHLEKKYENLKLMADSLNPGGKFVISHFDNLSQINEVHRNKGKVLENDKMPEMDEMESLCAFAGLEIKFLMNDDYGYFLYALPVDVY